MKYPIKQQLLVISISLLALSLGLLYLHFKYH